MITNFFIYFLKAPLEFFKKLLNTPIITMFYALLSKWYLVLMSLSVIVLYWVMKGLNEAGVFAAAYTAFMDAGMQIKGFAQHCTPLITDINLFVNCMMDTPEYTGDEITNAFEIDITKYADEFTIDHPVNHEKLFIVTPYDIINQVEDVGSKIGQDSSLINDINSTNINNAPNNINNNPNN